MKIFFIVICLVLGIDLSVAANVVIWDKATQKFAPIFNLNTFKTRRITEIDDIRKYETHNFKGEKLNFIYYNEHDVYQFYEDDRKVTGICGEIWTVLSCYLNFTMILTKSGIRTIGTKTNDNDNFTGLLGLLEQREYDVIPKMEAYLSRLDAVDMSVPFWKNQHRLYARPYYHFNITWMFDLFSWKIRCLIFVFYLLLSTLSILSEKITRYVDYRYLVSSYVDYFFYNFAALCNQGDVLYAVQSNRKLLSFCTSLFSWFLITSFSSQLIIYMTQTILVPPFDSLETLIDNTRYVVLAEKHSIVHIAFQKNYRPIYTRINEAKRIQFYTDYKHMWDLACSNSKRQYAVIQSETLKMDDNLACDLNPIGVDYFNTWIVGGIVKNFTYIKTINVGIIKLRETGIIHLLKSRWFKVKESNVRVRRYYTPITLDQVMLLISLYFFGFFMSIVLIIVEIIVFRRKNTQNK